MSNIFKTGLLLAVLTAMLVVIGGAIGGQQGMFIAFFLALAMNVFSYWYSDKMVLAMYRAQPLDERQAPELHAMVSRLAQRAQIPMPRVYLIPGDTPNAFATGRNPEHAVIAVTEGILRILDQDELEGVLAHELSHVKNRDVLISTIAATMPAPSPTCPHGPVAAIFGGRRGDDDEGGSSPIAMIAMAIVAPSPPCWSRWPSPARASSRPTPPGPSSPAARGGSPRPSRSSRWPSRSRPWTPTRPPRTFHRDPLSGRALMNLFSTHPRWRNASRGSARCGCSRSAHGDHRSMEVRILIGTEAGLWQLGDGTPEPVEVFAARELTALARDGARTWALVEGRTLWAKSEGGPWREHGVIEGPTATCLAASPGGMLVGTEHARLLRLARGTLSRVESFERVEGRDEWYTPWGDPAAVRSLAVATNGTIHANVHVGGVARSRDGGRSWAPTVDVEADIHQVLAHPTRPDVVLAAAYEGFGISRDGGDSWQFVTDGMHAHYSRRWPSRPTPCSCRRRRGRAAGARRSTASRSTATRRSSAATIASRGSPTTSTPRACRPPARRGLRHRGRPVFRSPDSGTSWELVTKGMPAVRCISLG